jgi:ABC-2 type transport system ATP-binding protein
MTAPAAIEVGAVGKSYGDRRVLDDVSFRVEAGEIFGLLGPNGAGKTTSVEIIEGYRRADSGQIRVLGSDPARAGRGHRARVGLMLQGGGGIDPRMTAREVVSLYGRFHADPRDVDELLEEVGLSGPAARTRYRRLSGGERQRVGLAVALVGRPEVAILDEPTAGMDVEARRVTRDLLLSLRDDGVAVLITSHDLADVERLADRVAILDRGRIVATGAPGDLAGSAGRGLRVRFAGPLNESALDELSRRLGGSSIEPEGEPGSYRFLEPDPEPAFIAALTAWCAEAAIRIVELSVGGGTLEERYLEIIAAGAEDDRSGTA